MHDKAAIVDGGPSGLAMIRALKAFGIDFEIIEQNTDLGGLRNHDWPLSPIYDSLHFTSSRTKSAFDGFPMPDDWPDYPRRGAVGGADHAKLRATIARNDYDLLKWLKTVARKRREAYVNRDAYAAALQKTPPPDGLAEN